MTGLPPIFGILPLGSSPIDLLLHSQLTSMDQPGDFIHHLLDTYRFHPIVLRCLGILG